MKSKSLNKNLHMARTAKTDEFYTQLVDIEKELKHYKEQFRDKVNGSFETGNHCLKGEDDRLFLSHDSSVTCRNMPMQIAAIRKTAEKVRTETDRVS